VKSDVPVEDATLNGLRVEVPWILKVIVEEVALIPSTVPLSKSDEVASVVGEIKRAMYPTCPPVTPEPLLSPSVEVDTHNVDVPVDQSTWPRVPDAFIESRKSPVRLRLVIERLVEVLFEKIVEDASNVPGRVSVLTADR
jgi:hypothetical protein